MGRNWIKDFKMDLATLFTLSEDITKDKRLSALLKKYEEIFKDELGESRREKSCNLSKRR